MAGVYRLQITHIRWLYQVFLLWGGRTMNQDRFICKFKLCGLILAVCLVVALPVLGYAEISAAESPAAPPRLYVAKTGDGSDPTGRWSTAYATLQDALVDAAPGSGTEIWVAAGVYYPDEGGGYVNNDVSATFVLKDGVSLYSAFDNRRVPPIKVHFRGVPPLCMSGKLEGGQC
jgi:hypothetical protein